MQDDATIATKKAVCRALTNIVKGSPLRSSVDPKAFFMMLHSNFAILQRGASFDLTHLWEVLSASHRTEALAGLFLKFHAACQDLGVDAQLPEVVANLSSTQKAEALRLYVNVESEFTPLPEVFLESVESGGGLGVFSEPVPALSTGDLVPILTDDLRRDLVAKIVQAVKAAPVGSRVDAGQLTFQLSSNLDDLIQGATFDLNPVLDGLRAIDGVGDPDLYVAVVRVTEALPSFGLELRPVTLEIDDLTKQKLLEYAEHAEAEARSAMLATVRGKEGTARTKDLPSRPKDSKEGTEEQRNARLLKKAASRLARYGFAPASSMTRKQRYLRVGSLVAIVAAIAILGYLRRPNRPFDVSEYDKIVPMKSAQIAQGAFIGVLDEERWYQIETKAREERIRTLEAQMRSDSLLQNMQIRDASGGLVITTGGNNRLVGASFILKGDGPKQP